MSEATAVALLGAIIGASLVTIVLQRRLLAEIAAAAPGLHLVVGDGRGERG